MQQTQTIVAAFAAAIILAITMNVAVGNHEILPYVPNGFPSLYYHYIAPIYHYLYGK